jgi:hypothetical protein
VRNTARCNPVPGSSPNPCSSGLPHLLLLLLLLLSRAALALHAPLTLWHVLVQLMPSRGWQLPPPGATIRVAYLGAFFEGKEAGAQGVPAITR